MPSDRYIISPIPIRLKVENIVRLNQLVMENVLLNMRLASAGSSMGII